MSVFSEKKLGIKQSWLLSINLCREAFSHIWHLGAIVSVCLTSSVIIKTLYKTAGIESKLISGVLPLLITLITIYAGSLILLKTYDVAHEGKKSWQDLFSLTNKKYIKVFVSMLIVLTLDSLGLLLLIFPGVFMFVLLIMVQPLLLFDDHGIISSIKSSCKLIWGNWWRTFTVISPIMFLGYWLNYFTVYAVSNQKWSMLVINLLAAAVFYPLFYACLITIFNDLKMRKNINKNSEPIVVTAVQDN